MFLVSSSINVSIFHCMWLDTFWTDHTRWFDISHKKTAWDVMHERARCLDGAANQQLPTAAAFWIIWMVSTEECSSLTQNLMQILCSTHSVILNVTATQYTCSLKGVCHPHWLVQWSHCWWLHSSPRSLAARLHWCCANHSHYINNGWTFSRQTSYSAALSWNALKI